MTDVAQNLAIPSKRHQDWLNCVAYIYFNNNQMDKAMSLWQSLLKLDDSNAYGRLALCQAYLSQKSYSEAIELAESFLGEETPPIKVYLILSQAYWGLEQKDEARKWAALYVENNQ